MVTGNGTSKDRQDDEKVLGRSCVCEVKLLLPALPAPFLLVEKIGGGVFLGSGRRRSGGFYPEEQKHTPG